MSVTKIYYIVGVALVILAALAMGWFVFLSPAPATPATSSTGLGSASDVSTSEPATTNTNNQQPVSTPVSTQKIFKIANGPVAGVVVIQTLHPTTTIARYVTEDTGHVLDITLDSPGSVARATSNTTIPGVVNTTWTSGGAGVILQYMDSDTIKTLSLSPFGTSSASHPAHIQFLPDNIVGIATSPDGKSVAYILHTPSGTDGYIARADGTGSKKLFSLGLFEVLISWPSPTLLLVQTKSAVGTEGAAFSVDINSGAVVPLLYGEGLTVSADHTFGRVLYQTNNGTDKSSHVHDTKLGLDVALSFSPFPEKCTWSPVTTTIFYCATPLVYLAPTFLDLWHQGVTSAADAILMFNSATGKSAILAAPGNEDGGVPSDILRMALSPDEHYLLFITKSDHSLWGVRLTQ